MSMNKSGIWPTTAFQVFIMLLVYFCMRQNAPTNVSVSKSYPG